MNSIHAYKNTAHDLISSDRLTTFTERPMVIVYNHVLKGYNVMFCAVPIKMSALLDPNTILQYVVHNFTKTDKLIQHN